MENQSDGLIEYDGQFRIIRINKVAEGLLGISASKISRQAIKAEDEKTRELSALVRVTFPIFGKKVQDENNTTELSQPHSIEVHEVIVDYPSNRKLRVYTTPKTDEKSNSPIGYIKIIRDITRDDVISKSKSDLVAVVAHQLRTPLSSIKWIFGALNDGDFGQANPEQKKIILRGLETNENLIRLVDDILNVSKIEQAQFDYTFSKKRVKDFIAETILPITEKALARKINIRNNVLIETDITLDDARVKMALSNIIDNAINYSPEGSTVEIDAKESGDYINISIKDSGIGIPKDSEEKLFHKFYRANNAKTYRTGGTGLGLFLAKTVIEGHGGKINYQSEEGRGTIFTISMPKVPKAPKKDLGWYEGASGGDRVFGV